MDKTYFDNPTIEGLIDKVKDYLPSVDEEVLIDAYKFAKKAHSGQLRYSGEPYIIHPLSAAYILSDLEPDQDSLIACILHDVPEDTDVTLEDIETEFGPEVTKLVAGVGKLSLIRVEDDELKVDNWRKLFLVMANDIRVVLIKLAERLHNIMTLEHVPKYKRKRIAKETLSIYAAISARLGIYQFKTRLEDLCFKWIHPIDYKKINRMLLSYKENGKPIIDHATSQLNRLLNDSEIEHIVEGRVKHRYSIFRKMKLKDKDSLEEVFDLFALRVVLPDKYTKKKEYFGHLYSALGLVHKDFSPLPGRFKDYVAAPKSNGYRSLHTTVLGLGGDSYKNPVEIQIRTEKMHKEAEFGIATHWKYKSKNATTDDGEAYAVQNMRNQINWLKNIADEGESKGRGDSLGQLEFDVFRDRIFVLTPMGKVLDLPKGATPVDFAYMVHTDVGHRTAQAKVNGKIVPLDYELDNGEIVEIITKKDPSPNTYWLQFVKTSHARNSIKSWFKLLDRDTNVKYGRDLLNTQLKKLGKPSLGPNYNLLKVYDDSQLTIKDRENVLESVGNGTVTVGHVLKKMFKDENWVSTGGGVQKRVSDSRKKLTKSSRAKRNLAKSYGVLITGQDNLPIVLSSCCTPKFPDEIVGYVTRGRNIRIHKKTCANLFELDAERFVDSSWDNNTDMQHLLSIRMVANDRIGLMRDLTSTVSDMGLNILDITLVKKNDGKLTRDITLTISSLDQLSKLIYRIEQISGVTTVNKVA